MPRLPQKSQYKKIENRIIFLMRSPLSKEFFIGHCQPHSLMPIFRQHCAGDRYYTNVCFTNLKKQGLHPCLTILEEVKCTQVEAYSHIIAWTKIFVDAGYTNLNTGNVMDYIEDLYEKSKTIYEVNKTKILTEICSCNSCIVSNYGYKKCPYAGD